MPLLFPKEKLVTLVVRRTRTIHEFYRTLPARRHCHATQTYARVVRSTMHVIFSMSLKSSLTSFVHLVPYFNLLPLVYCVQNANLVQQGPTSASNSLFISDSQEYSNRFFFSDMDAFSMRVVLSVEKYERSTREIDPLFLSTHFFSTIFFFIFLLYFSLTSFHQAFFLNRINYDGLIKSIKIFIDLTFK